MSRQTPEERRRVHQAQQRARASMRARLEAPLTVASHAGTDEHGRRLLVTAMVTAAMLGGGFLASQTFEFNLPATLAEALFPRL